MWRDHISDLPWSRIGVKPTELSEVAENRGVFEEPPWAAASATKRKTGVTNVVQAIIKLH